MTGDLTGRFQNLNLLQATYFNVTEEKKLIMYITVGEWELVEIYCSKNDKINCYNQRSKTALNIGIGVMTKLDVGPHLARVTCHVTVEWSYNKCHNKLSHYV